MIVAAVKAQNTYLVREIVEGRGPKDEGLNNSEIDERSIHLADDFGDTPLIWAAALGNEEMVELLLDSGADLRTGAESDGDQPLHRAVKFRHMHIIKLIMERCDPKLRRKLLRAENKLGCTPLHLAAKYGLDEIAELLMEFGGNPDMSDERGYTSKDLASLNDHSLTRAVLDDPETARAEAEKRRAEALRHENDMNLLEACKIGNQAWAAEVLSKGANLHQVDEHGDTPLHLSAQHAHDELSKFLVSQGADPIARNHAGKMPQHYDTTLQWFQASAM